MPISFPTSPVLNDTYTYSGKVWTWNGSVWQANSTATVVGPEGPAGPTGEAGPSGVVSVTSPITNSGTSTSATIGINQSLIAINASQVATTATTKTDFFTLTSADKNTYILCNNNFGMSVDVPDVLANGESVNIIQTGTAAVSIFGSGITINSIGGKSETAGQFAAATIVKLAGAYYLVGNLA